jgi:hypothetical protein
MSQSSDKLTWLLAGSNPPICSAPWNRRLTQLSLIQVSALSSPSIQPIGNSKTTRRALLSSLRVLEASALSSQPRMVRSSLVGNATFRLLMLLPAIKLSTLSILARGVNPELRNAYVLRSSSLRRLTIPQRPEDLMRESPQGRSTGHRPRKGGIL